MVAPYGQQHPAMHIGPWQEYRLLKYIGDIRAKRMSVADEESRHRLQLEELELKESPLPRICKSILAATEALHPMTAYRQGALRLAALEPTDFLLPSNENLARLANARLIRPEPVNGDALGQRVSRRLCRPLLSSQASDSQAAAMPRGTKNYSPAARFAHLWPLQPSVPSTTDIQKNVPGGASILQRRCLDEQVKRRLRLEALYTFSYDNPAPPPVSSTTIAYGESAGPSNTHLSRNEIAVKGSSENHTTSSSQLLDEDLDVPEDIADLLVWADNLRHENIGAMML